MASTLNMRRDAKTLIGKRLMDECLGITTQIQLANMDTDKTAHITKLLVQKSRVELLLKKALDLKLISPGQYGLAVRHAVDVGRQAVGWKRNSQQRQFHDRQGGHDRA